MGSKNQLLFNVLFRVRLLFVFLFLVNCIQAFAAEGKSVLSNEVWTQLKTLTGIRIASDKSDIPQLVVFFDPNCPHCARLWKQLYSADSANKKIATFWVPVSYMNKDSIGKAAFLAESNSRELLATNFNDFDFKRRTGAAKIIAVKPMTQNALNRNNGAWEKLFAATPLLVYRTRSGEVFSQIGCLMT